MSFDQQKGEKVKETDCTSQTGDSTHEYVSFFGAIVDIIGNLSITTIVVVSIISAILTSLWSTIDYCEAQKMQLCGDILIMCSCVLGFSIAGFSVILSLNVDALLKLSFSPTIPNRWWKCFIKKKSTPFDILCASFSSTCIILLLTIIVVILYRNMPVPLYTKNWHFVLIQVLSIVSALLVIDLVIHLYAVSTYLNGNHNRVKICSK